jgi:hypothetical protein
MYTFQTDVLACPKCDGRPRVLGQITEPALIRLVLETAPRTTLHYDPYSPGVFSRYIDSHVRPLKGNRSYTFYCIRDRCLTRPCDRCERRAVWRRRQHD